MTPSVLVDQVRELVGTKVDAVERHLVETLDGCPGPLREAAVTVFESGGKRMRPLLHLLFADLAGYRGPLDVVYATAVEYVHVASLLHDDVIDQAVLRRGQPTLNQKLGNTMTVLVGDYLCMKAVDLAVRAGNDELLGAVTRTTLDLVAGEALQEAASGRMDVDADEYLEIVELKTGRLMASACEMATMLVGTPPQDRRRRQARAYGLALGRAFQLADDILDFESDEATLGKPVLSDLREGTVTFPVIHALRVGGEEARRLVATVLEDGGFDRVRAETIVGLVRETGGVEAARDLAETAAAAAREALEAFPEGLSRQALAFATEYAVRRQF